MFNIFVSIYGKDSGNDVDVPMTRKRDRTGVDFLRIRDKVIEEFKMKQEISVEY